MEEESAARDGARRVPALVKKLWGYAAGMLVEVLTVAALCAAAVVVMLVVKALA